MADWRKLAKAMTLADGRIDTKEVEILRKELFADDKIDKSELEFLADLKNGASGVVQAFNDLFNTAVKNHVLADGSISDAEAGWLRKMIFADGKADDAEKKLLTDLAPRPRRPRGVRRPLQGSARLLNGGPCRPSTGWQGHVLSLTSAPGFRFRLNSASD